MFLISVTNLRNGTMTIYYRMPGGGVYNENQPVRHGEALENFDTCIADHGIADHDNQNYHVKCKPWYCLAHNNIYQCILDSWYKYNNNTL